MNNGRITLDLNNANDYSFTDDSLKPIYKPQIISGITATPLYSTFFSEGNITFIQNTIIEKVKEQSSHVISKQDENNLIVIMRSTYLQYTKNTDDFQTELNSLNTYVVNYSVKNIINNISHYLYYLNDISNLPRPLEHPKYMRPDGLKNYKDIIEQ